MAVEIFQTGFSSTVWAADQARPPSLLRRILRQRATGAPGRFHCGAAMSSGIVESGEVGIVEKVALWIGYLGGDGKVWSEGLDIGSGHILSDFKLR